MVKDAEDSQSEKRNFIRRMFGGIPLTVLLLLNRVESKAFHLISSPSHTECLQPLSHCRNVTPLAIFYLYIHANCSSDLADCMPPILLCPSCTRLYSSSHPYSVQLSDTRVNQYSPSFIPLSGKLWISLPSSVFLSSYDLT
ncbi:hypothetical protein E2C01_021931 [Portunus trituberculatus]|uniref:Uncharacterized protein n=1 Tax=Portunus trituberculatus TaxID=210409 RepID=A0A5B7E3W5_PORTR|nr:hypothetical protein [Portunus trituberculatus]